MMQVKNKVNQTHERSAEEGGVDDLHSDVRLVDPANYHFNGLDRRRRGCGKPGYAGPSNEGWCHRRRWSDMRYDDIMPSGSDKYWHYVQSQECTSCGRRR